MRPAVGERDRLLILRYLDGELSPTEMCRFEARLSEESDLADLYERFERVDRLERTARRRPPRARPHWARLAAAAVVAGFAVGAWWVSRSPAELDREVAVMASDVSLQRYQALLGLAPDVVPPGFGDRSLQGTTDVAVEEYVSNLHSAERERAEAALGAGGRREQSAYFRVVYRARVASSVVVISVGPEDGVRRLFPAGATDATLAAGHLHLLPGPGPAVAADPHLVDFDPGYLVPRETDVLTVLVAARPADLDGELLDELDSVVAEDVERWLRDRGFSVERFEVVAP